MELKRAVWCCLGGLLSLSVSSNAAAAFFSKKKENQPEAESPIKVNVQGASDELAENIKAYLPSMRGLSCNSSADRMQRFVDASQSKMVKGVEAMGYFSAKLDMQPAQQSGCWVLNVQVDSGLPVLVKESNIKLTGEGSKLPLFSKLVAENPYEPNEVLVSQKYEDLKTNLSRTASRLGFFDANFVQREIRVDPDTREAVINLHFETGQRYQIGEVKVTQDILDEENLAHYLRVHQGEPYDSDVLLTQQRLLENSGYYSDVRINTNYRDAKGNQVPLEINAIRNKRYSYTATFGYATGSGARLEGTMETRWLNSKGHKLDTGFRFSQNDKNVRATYKVPLWKPEHEYASVSGGWATSDNKDIQSDKFNLELSYNRRNKANWQQTAYVNLLNERTKVDGEPAISSLLTLFGARVSKTESNDSLFPTQGWRAQAEIKGSHDALLSDLTILQGTANLRYLTTFDNGSKVIAQGGIGASKVDDITNVPKSLRFFAGGQNSVRGYDFETIGTTDDKGLVVGGRNTLTTSLEYEYPVAEKISVAAFVDAGDAFDSWGNVNMKVGAGVGARYKSPIGPIRVDFAVPKDDTSDVHFYFSLGPDL